MKSKVLEEYFSLEGRIGIVTGASSGIGRGVAHLLADAGAKVYNFSRHKTKTEGLDFEINRNVEDVTIDVTDLEQLKIAVDQIAAVQGLDFLINNAGITKRVAAEKVDEDWWRTIHKLNTDVPFFLAQYCFQYLKKSPYVGRVVNISSMAAHLGFDEVVPYCSTKSAIAGISRGLAVEWANSNVLVNSVAPGWIQTNMTKTVADPDRLAKIIGRMPLHRYGNPRKDIGTMIWFLISDAACYITGQDIAVDGGALCYGF